MDDVQKEVREEMAEAVDMTAPAEAAVEAPAEEEVKRHWYVIHTYSGYEKKVSSTLERKVKSLGLEDQIFNIVIPLETEEELDDNGQRHMVTRKMFPGYVMLDMIVNDRTWYVVRNTPGVTGFVGPDNKSPVPLADTEAKRILRSMGLGTDEDEAAPEARPECKYQLQQVVRIKSGPFTGMTGTISEIDLKSGKLKVELSMFGRTTPTDIDYTLVEEIE